MGHLLYVLALMFGVLSPNLSPRLVEVVLAKPHPGMVCGEAWVGLQPGTPELGAPRDHHECVCACTCVCVRACVHTRRVLTLVKG